MKRIFQIGFMVVLWAATLETATAQQELQIATVFERYGKSSGATMVEMSNEMLDAYEMTLYKSLMIRTPSQEVKNYILKCVEADKKKAKTIKEVMDDGKLRTGYYQFGQVKEDVNRYILYKENKKGVLTLIYIEGEIETDDLVTLLFMKQNEK